MFGHCAKSVSYTHLVKGYEYEKDKYVIISGDDLEKIQTEKDKTIQILKFVKEAEVDPIYFCLLYTSCPVRLRTSRVLPPGLPSLETPSRALASVITG